MAAAQHPADAVERVARAAPVAGLLALDAAADVIDGGEAEAYLVERVEHPQRVRQAGTQRVAYPRYGSSAVVLIPARLWGARSRAWVADET
jgi:hypothetical protein